MIYKIKMARGKTVEDLSAYAQLIHSHEADKAIREGYDVSSESFYYPAGPISFVNGEYLMPMDNYRK